MARADLEDDPLSGDPGPPPVPAAPAVVVPRWIQLVLLPLALLWLWALVRASGAVVLLFIIAALVALLLNPFVEVLRRAGLPRGPAVLAVFAVGVLVLAAIVALLANPVADQVSTFSRNVPGYVEDANAALADAQRWLNDNGIDVEIARQGQTAFETLGDRLAQGSGDVVEFTREALTTLVEASLALILVIVISVYMLLYAERIGAGVRAVVPKGDGTPEDDFPTRIQRAVFGYVRGQLLFSSIMGLSAGALLFVLGSVGIFEEGRQYALVFGAFYGVAELIPYVGPVIGASPPMIIALFGDPLDALWLGIAFIGLQQIEGHIVAPQVFAHSLRINPLLVIFALLTGGQLYGIIGAFVALPISAMLRETIVYARRHFVLESWSTPLAVAGVGATGGAGPPSAERSQSAVPGHPSARASQPAGSAEASAATSACPECDSPVAPGTTTCPACGTVLGPPDEMAAATAGAPG